MNIRIHATLDTMQSSHGLSRQNDDYKQYREYCTRRLSRLRHHKSVRTDLVHSMAYVKSSNKGGGNKKRHAYCPRNNKDLLLQQTNEKEEGNDNDDEKEGNDNDEKEENNEDDKKNNIETTKKDIHENFLYVVFVECERAWSHSNELRALLNEKEANKLARDHPVSKSSSGKIRQRAVSRLRRAKQLATKFLELCREYADDTTVEEAKAYAAWMNGNFAFETNQWKVACDEFQTAITLCTKLSQYQGEEAEEDRLLEIRDLFVGRANNVLKPLLKYCQYEWKESSGEETMEEVTTSSVEKKEEKKENAFLVTYRDQPIAIQNKELKVLLLKAESINDTTLSADAVDESSFLSLLSMYDDAHAIVSNDLQKYQDMKSGPAVNAKRSELDRLSGYIRYQKLRLSMAHQERIIASASVIADLAQLYDALFQDAKAVCDLPGEEDEFFLEASANVLRIRAFRSFYVAQLYASLRKYPQALTLTNRAEELAHRANEEIAACDDMIHADAYMDALDRLLQNDLPTIKLRFQLQTYLSNSGSSTTTGGDMFSQLDKFQPASTIVDLAPIPMPAKPAFFDIAWNYASHFPEEELKAYVNENKPKASGGLMSWFRS